MSVVATTRERRRGHYRRLLLDSVVPGVVGAAAGVAIGADGGVPSALMMCAMVYLFAAALARPAAAWWGLACGLPLIGVGAVLDNEWLSVAALGGAQLVVIGVGQLRRRWNDRRHLRQLAAAVAFATLAVVAAAGASTTAAVIVIAGMVTHAVWDVAHHRAGAVVARSYSAFCAGLDAVLAVVITVALFAGA